MIKDTSSQDTFIESSRFNRGRMGIALICLTALITTALYGFERWQEVEQSVSSERLRFSQVQRGDFIRDVAVQGEVIAAVSPTSYSPNSGIITLQVKVGDEVSKGQLVATIDNPELGNRLLQEQTTLSKLKHEYERQAINTRKQKLKSQQNIDLAKVRLDAADREMRRAQLSIETKAISQLDFEKAQDDLSTARLEHQHAIQDSGLETESLEFELKTRQLDVDRQMLTVSELERQTDRLSILSEVFGIVGSIEVDQKEQVIINQPILTVVDLSEFELEIRIPESYADDIGLDMAAVVRWGTRKLPAKVIAVSPEIINNQVRGRLKFTGEKIVGLKQNQRLSAQILLESKKDVLKIQRGPFFDSGAGHVAYVVHDKVATRTSIRTGSIGTGEIEILEGLMAGDTIVISSYESFNDVQTILIN